MRIIPNIDLLVYWTEHTLVNIELEHLHIHRLNIYYESFYELIQASE